MEQENDSYNEGWADCSKYFTENYISTLNIVDILDKYFDRINELKRILFTIEDYLNNPEKCPYNKEDLLKQIKRIKNQERKLINESKRKKKNSNRATV